MKKHHFGWLLSVGIAVLIISACTSYVYQSVHIRRLLSEQDYSDALKTVEKSNTGGSRLLYFYEKGLILHYANKYELSNEAFDQAEAQLDELYTRTLGREIGALITTDNIVQYRGDRYESAFVNYYRILNYLYLGQDEEALIECRKLNHKLQLFEDSGGSYYENDPFLQYFTGMVYAATGEYVDADVSFRAARDAYETLAESYNVSTPAYIYCDLIRSARYFGDVQALEEYENPGTCDQSPVAGKALGTLNLFIEYGYVPIKREETVSLPIFKRDLEEDYDNDEFAHVLLKRYGEPRRNDIKVDYWLKIAVPSMPAPPADVEGLHVSVEGHKGKGVEFSRVENFNALALKAFEEKKGKIMLRATVRALAKYLAANKTKKKKGEVAGWVVNIFNVATESADTRSWSTLPGEIFMGRLVLPEGMYTLNLNLMDASGRCVETTNIKKVEITAHAQKFLNYRIY